DVTHRAGLYVKAQSLGLMTARRAASSRASRSCIVHPTRRADSSHVSDACAPRRGVPRVAQDSPSEDGQSLVPAHRAGDVTRRTGLYVKAQSLGLMMARHAASYRASRNCLVHPTRRADSSHVTRSTSSSGFLFDPEIEKTARANRKAVRQVKDAEEENHIPVPPPRRTLGDYGQRNNGGIANLGFQPVNPVTFEIKNTVINALKEDQYSGAESRCPNHHLSHFYDACDYTNPPGILESDKRLRLIKFSLTGRAKDWLDTIPPGTISTWQDLERKFKDRYFPIHKFLERWSEIMNFEQAGGSLKHKDEIEAKELVETMAQNEYRAQNDRRAKKKAGILELDTNNVILVSR
ncbi:hypothetical protein TSUD_418050, partial [Trifolium subterraneum]